MQRGLTLSFGLAALHLPHETQARVSCQRSLTAAHPAACPMRGRAGRRNFKFGTNLMSTYSTKAFCGMRVHFSWSEPYTQTLAQDTRAKEGVLLNSHLLPTPRTHTYSRQTQLTHHKLNKRVLTQLTHTLYKLMHSLAVQGLGWRATSRQTHQTGTCGDASAVKMVFRLLTGAS